MNHPDPIDDPEFQEFAERVRSEMIPKLDGSAVCLSLVPRNPSDLDVKYAVELAFTLLLDKPLVLLVEPGTPVPDHLIRAADAIVEFDPADIGGTHKRLIAVLDGLNLGT